jgi:hypothetical protein
VTEAEEVRVAGDQGLDARDASKRNQVLVIGIGPERFG